jgi:hypothetical protein
MKFVQEFTTKLRLDPMRFIVVIVALTTIVASLWILLPNFAVSPATGASAIYKIAASEVGLLVLGTASLATGAGMLYGAVTDNKRWVRTSLFWNIMIRLLASSSMALSSPT